MKHKTAFTKKDLVVALICLVFLLANLAAVGGGGRKRAKQAVCFSNIRQWGNIFAMYLDDYEGYFWEGWNKPTATGDVFDDNWMHALRRYGAGVDYEFWCCPMATKPRKDMQGNRLRPYGPYTAWGMRGPNPTQIPPDVYGSYGLNGWVHHPVGKGDEETIRAGYEVKYCWRNANVKGASNIPLFLGSMHHELHPRHTDPIESGGGAQMHKACVAGRRHNGAINMLFLDLSARRVPVTCMWNFKWNRNFDIYADKPDFKDTWMEKFEADCD